MRHLRLLSLSTVLVALAFAWTGQASLSDAQTMSGPNSARNATSSGRPVVIPLTIRVKEAQPEPELQNIDLTVSEDGEPQTVLSIRGLGTSSPITVAILIQEDLVPSVGNETKSLADFVRNLPRGSRVMVGYLRTGTIQVKQKFTTDLEKAAKGLRPPQGLPSAGPYNPYVEVIEALKKFESQPLGRRAILLVSDGLDVSRGVELAGPTQSLDLQRAINESQRRSVAIYSFYAPTLAAEGNSLLSGYAQSSLLRISNETGGHAFFQGTGAPVSFDPFIKELMISLDKQAALTFLSTHSGKGFHRIEVRSSTPGVKVAYPSGYMRQ